MANEFQDRIKKKESDNKKTDSNKAKKSLKRELIEFGLIIFVIVPFINMFIMQSYAIPTSSMEGEMLIGDRLFVSKINYGARVPMTPIALPYVHNKIGNSPSYTEAIKLPYYRLPGLGTVERNDIVVFNYPGDKVNGMPVDKRENYIKRCVGIAGDTLSVKGCDVYINGKPSLHPRLSQYLYAVKAKDPSGINPKIWEDLGVRERLGQADDGRFIMRLTDATAAKMKTMDAFEMVEKMLVPAGKGEPQIYPQNPNSNWNVDYFGPIYLPKRGDKVKIDSSNYLLYAPAIRDYEGNSDVSWNSAEKKISVNGQLSDTYEFKMNYYFMMGDNRHNSLDSRYWGMVPEDHIVGTPVFVWLSTNDQAKGWGDWIRWDKSFRFVK